MADRLLPGGAGLFAGTDPLLGELLGREPRTVEDVLRAAVAA